MQVNTYTHLVWDFNGTILDDVDASVKSANQLLRQYGLAELSSIDEYRARFGFPIIDYYRRLGFDFDKISYETLAPQWVGYYLENARDAGLCNHVGQVLAEVRSRGISQWILSATEEAMLTRQVASLGLLPYFDGLLGMDNIHAYSKEEIGVAWRRKHSNARILMLGDTDHDAAVAAAMGADCILLTTGHQTRAHLETCPCLFVAETAQEILRIL